MANCLINTLSAIWSFIIGSLRMILFFGSVIFVFVQILWIWMLVSVSRSDTQLDMPGTKVGLHDFIISLSLLGVALLGCYGSFYKHHFSVRMFALLTALSAGWFIFDILGTSSPESIQQMNKEFFDKMDKFLDDYDWRHSSSSENKATQNWDNLQHLLCCGIKGSNDWNKYRPSSVPKDAFPSSCCLHNNQPDPFNSNEFCYKDNKSGKLFEDGCQERLNQIAAVTMMVSFQFIVLQLFLCIVACIVGTLDLEGCNHSSRNPVAMENATARVYSPQQYQRFESSVYVRQPPVNQDYLTHGNDKYVMPPVYPDLSREQNVPPPSYGTGK